MDGREEHVLRVRGRYLICEVNTYLLFDTVVLAQEFKGA